MKLKLNKNVTLTITPEKLDAILHPHGYELKRRDGAEQTTFGFAPNLDQKVMVDNKITTIREALDDIINEFPRVKFTAKDIRYKLTHYPLLNSLMANPIILGKYLTARSNESDTPFVRVLRNGRAVYMKNNSDAPN